MKANQYTRRGADVASRGREEVEVPLPTVCQYMAQRGGWKLITTYRLLSDEDPPPRIARDQIPNHTWR